MTSYTVEKGIPLPSPRTRDGSKYPMDSMEVGDSFLVLISDYASPISATCSVLAAAKRGFPEKKFTTRTLNAEHIRVWRVA